MNLFQTGKFTLHSGEETYWKIDCDALTELDIDTLVLMFLEIVPPFGSVEGVPSGGLRLADALKCYATEGPLLVVDDVFTTGGSIERHLNGRRGHGAVIFARNPTPWWIRPLFRMK